MALKDLFIKARKIRNAIEDKIADLLKLFQNEKVDKAEIRLIQIAIDKGLQVATSNTIVLTNEQTEAIASEIVNGLNKLNDLTQKLLRKKSKRG